MIGSEYTKKINLPLSKSIVAREMIISIISNNQAFISDPEGEYAEDINVLKNIIEEVRAASQYNANFNIPKSLYVGNSGTAMRLLTAVIAASGESSEISGGAQVSQRPIAPLIETLRGMGAEIEYLDREGYLPLSIKGKQLHCKDRIDARGWQSSQYVSALLLIAPKVSGDTRILRSRDDSSTPYIDLTIECMRRHGIEVKWEGDLITVKGGQSYLTDAIHKYEYDWSSASFWYQLLALHPEVRQLELRGLSYHNAIQGDRVVADMYQTLGIQTHETTDGILLSHTGKEPRPGAKMTELDFALTPDLFPTLSVTYAMLGIPIKCTGLSTLAIKESNRIEAVVEGLRRIGIGEVTSDGDTFIYHGSRGSMAINTEIEIDSREDHRIAMAFAIAATALDRCKVSITDPECVAKSYPSFWDELRKFTTIDME